MPLTEAQAQAIDQWLLHGGRVPESCPICNSKYGFDYGDIVAVGDKPMLTFECPCGYVLFFMATRIPGLLGGVGEQG